MFNIKHFDIKKIKNEINKIDKFLKNKYVLIVFNKCDKISSKDIDLYKKKMFNKYNYVFTSVKYYKLNNIIDIILKESQNIMFNNDINENNFNNIYILKKIIKGLDDIINKYKNNIVYIDILYEYIVYVNKSFNNLYKKNISNEEIYDNIFSKFCVGK